MRSEYFKNLTEQEAYNITNGLSVILHEISLKRLGLDWNTLDTDISNEISEIIDEEIDSLHEQLNDRLEEFSQENAQAKEDGE